MRLNQGLMLAGIAALTAGFAAPGWGQTAAAWGAIIQADAGPQDPHNPLIGKWHFIGFGAGPTTSSSACSIDMTFTPGRWMQTRAGATTNIPVTYVPGPKTVYVVGSDGGHITYILVDQNHIALNSFAPCTYARVGKA